MKKHIYILGVAALTMLLNACSASWLDQQPSGGTITESQYQKMDNVLEGSVRGIYSSMYQYGGDHDVFGQRSIDMYGDFTCGDMAMKSFNYGWFQTDEIGQSYTRRAYIWSYYYDMIRLCNKAINAVQSQIGKNDLKNEKLIRDNAQTFFYYAEILAMRGWCYANLQKWFCYTTEYLTTQGVTLDQINSVPIYTEEVTEADTSLGAPLSTAAEVYARAEEDLKTAIHYFEITAEEGMQRGMKHEVNSDVARLMLAYCYLNKGSKTQDYTDAAKYAEDFLNITVHTVLPKTELQSTGFSDINSNNWVWGQDVTVQTTTSLASFFGQCDVFSYSYAWAGDAKGIDQNLYDAIPAWDLRKEWWNNFYNNGVKSYQYAPDGKFYSPTVMRKVGYTRAPNATELDRDWLCDQVYMRTELGFIIAAEAEARLGNLDDALNLLREITDNRVLDTSDPDYLAWIASIEGDEDALLAAIQYNWRVEFWGEGYGLQTFRRFGESYTLGENHKTRANKTISVNDASTLRQYTFSIPSGELYYNPYLRSDSEMAVDE